MLSASCPACGKVVSAKDLSSLAKAVRGCCGARKKGKKGGLRVSTVTLPLFPVAFTFMRSPASQNSTTYSHWRSHYNDKREWKRVATPAFSSYKGVCLWYSRWSLLREYTHPNREMDYANLVGGCKPLIDLLVKFDIIYDDSPTHFSCSYEQLAGDSTRTTLILHEGVLTNDSETRHV